MPPDIRASAIARLRAAWTGSPWADRADRQLANELEAGSPGMRELARRGLEFHRRACRWALGQGCGTVIFTPAGLPADPEPHLRDDGSVPPFGKFVFADVDEATTLLNEAERARGHGNVLAVQASARDPEAVLAAAGADRCPVSVQLQFALHWWPADLAREVIGGYARLMPSGSILAVSAGVFRKGRGRRWQRQYSAAGGAMYRHAARDIDRWLADAGLEIAESTVVRPGDPKAVGELLLAVTRVP